MTRDLHIHFHLGCDDGRLRAIDDGIQRMEQRMTDISDELDQNEQGLNALGTAMQNLTDEFAKLKEDIVNQGQRLRPEHQARFDAFQARMQTLTDQVNAATGGAPAGESGGVVGTTTGGGGEVGDGSADTGAPGQPGGAT